MVAAVAFGFADAGRAQDTPKKDDATDLNDVALEVNALQSLYSLRLNETQLQKLRALAKDTGQKTGSRTPAMASKEYREKLQALRTALVELADERIDELNEQLDDLRESEKPTIDDGVEITEAARKAAPAVLKLLMVQQLKDYAESLGEALVDPQTTLADALSSVRDLNGKAWRDRREELVDQIVRLSAGVDAARSEKLADQLTALLSTAHALSDEEFKARKPKLEEAAHQLLGDLDPVQVMRNAVEYSLAELLSNPRLQAAIEARTVAAK
jgi:hypothetical protein